MLSGFLHIVLNDLDGSGPAMKLFEAGQAVGARPLDNQIHLCTLNQQKPQTIM